MVDTVCLWAETKGGVTLAKQIDVEICGTEITNVVGPDKHTFDLFYRDVDFWNGG